MACSRVNFTYNLYTIKLHKQYEIGRAAILKTLGTILLPKIIKLFLCWSSSLALFEKVTMKPSTKRYDLFSRLENKFHNVNDADTNNKLDTYMIL